MDYRPIIESRYNRENWQLLLHDIFGNKIKFWHTPSVVGTSSQFAKQALWLGTITLSDGRTISVYEVELADSVDIERNRRGIRDMLLTAWRNNGNAGAFMFCYRKNESVLRFSYVSEAWAFAEDGTYQKESTDTKRFTYLLGEGHRSRTAIQQFEKLRDSKLSLRDLTKAFSVDAVSDMFFDGYKKQYEDIIQYITGKRMVKVANKWEEQIKNDPCEEIMQEFARFPNPEKAVRDYVKKLMGRLVFLQFLQKKGWLGVPAGEPWGTGDREFIQNLFANCQDKDHFIDNVLEVLFNDLNTEREGDLATPSLGGGRGRLIPYLNGGLFERDATDETAFPLPAKYMQSLLDFFASYNFTIDENDPDDAEVGVDPEMLGRIFENLLEDNKDKGAFYTPKEIVSYMCRESLIAYLQTDIDDEATKEAIRQFVTTHDVKALGTNGKFRQQVDEALKNVKICDPAIGSGAFPMGLLKELFQCRTALEGITQSKAAEIKKHIIQQNIYGVDIERGAVDIARLRFWLSLIVDEENPQALPNLDFKIMQGNSLLEQYKGVDLSTMTDAKWKANESLSIFNNMLDVYRRDMRIMITQYYDCTNHDQKQSLKRQILENVKDQLVEQHINPKDIDVNLSENNQFFLWHTWFFDVFSLGGFDIVIGNPPYINISKVPQYSKELESYKEIHTGYNDLMYYFIYHGLSILKQNGILNMITSNYFLGNDYALKLRNVLKEKLMRLYNFHSALIFESANVHTCISFATNNVKESDVHFYIFKYDKKKGEIDFNVDFSNIVINRESLTNTWIIANSNSALIIGKLLKDSIPLGKIAEIEQGSKSGKNKIFTVPREFAVLNKFESGIVRNNVKNGDVLKYYIKDRGNCLLYTDNDTDITKYPNAKSYLEQYKMVLIGRNEVAKGLYKWYRFDRPRRKEIFDAKEKIIVPYRAEHNRFAYDDCQYFNDGGDIRAIVIINEKYPIKYVLGILNSSLMDWFFGFIGKVKGRVREYFNNPLSQIPIKGCSSVVQETIIKLVDKILSAKRSNPSADTSALESEIDRLVYQLYGLTDEEIKIVEQS
ncbi:MAG: Eco57I restriction-modification methylase domain-containing protein [Prevotella sp.]|nr:Eco57I restriction-modification methylase domain-containing protein [Prevotella sp.]